MTNTQPEAQLSIPYVPKTMYYQHNQNTSGVVGSDNDIRDSEPKYLESIDTIPAFQDKQPLRKEQDNCNIFPAIQPNKATESTEITASNVYDEDKRERERERQERPKYYDTTTRKEPTTPLIFFCKLVMMTNILIFISVYHEVSDYSFSKVLTSVPICGRISTLNSSPWERVSLGFLPMPTPAGVPVIMTVPAGRVVPCDKKLTSFGTLKMRSLGDVS